MTVRGLKNVAPVAFFSYCPEPMATNVRRTFQIPSNSYSEVIQRLLWPSPSVDGHCQTKKSGENPLVLQDVLFREDLRS